MNKFLLRLTFVTIVFYYAFPAKAQLGQGIFVGPTISSYRNDDLNSKGGVGFEIGYLLFAKYSDRLEWNSSMSFLQAKRNDVTAYKLKPELYSGEKIADYNATTISLNTSQLNLSYTLSYYVIPDQLAVVGGFDLGIDMFSQMSKATSSKYDEMVLLRVDSSSGTPELKKKAIEDLGFPFIYYGPSMGLSYSYDDRFVVYAKYTLFLNKSFTEDDISYDTTPDESKLNLLRIGFAYKFLPSAKDKRF